MQVIKIIYQDGEWNKFRLGPEMISLLNWVPMFVKEP